LFVGCPPKVLEPETELSWAPPLSGECQSLLSLILGEDGSSTCSNKKFWILDFEWNGINKLVHKSIVDNLSICNVFRIILLQLSDLGQK
jgi:hypothetical protein